MAEITLQILATEAAQFEAAIEAYHAFEKERATTSFLSYKAKEISVVSKEKTEWWEERNPANAYEYRLAYEEPEQVLLLGISVGVKKTLAHYERAFIKPRSFREGMSPPAIGHYRERARDG